MIDPGSPAPADDLPATVREAFGRLTGRPPEGLWAAPGRVNVIGEHTDYNDGFVLPFAIDRRVVVAAARRDDGLCRVHSLQQPDQPVTAELASLAPGNVSGWAAYVLGVAWVLRERGAALGGVDLMLSGDVPSGAGLSSSAALECAAGLALADLFGLTDDATERARIAQRAENDFVGVPCGLMDQLASTRGLAGHALLIDIRTLDVRPTPLHLEAAGLTLLIVDTRASHSLADGEYARRRASCEAAARSLGVAALRDVEAQDLLAVLARLDDVTARRVRHVVTENARVLQVDTALQGGDWAAVGQLMTASHVSLRDDYEVSAPELDTVVEAALGVGALGARMTGGGFGGSAIALVAADAADGVTEAVTGAFAQRGFPAPRIFTAVPSDGARRLTA
ncbi:MAG: galactokinase [Actinomycetota bacterium]|nr:galactokinase [Actinomycetota bacterium]